jgi:hypothetical protein
VLYRVPTPSLCCVVFALGSLFSLVLYLGLGIELTLVESPSLWIGSRLSSLQTRLKRLAKAEHLRLFFRDVCVREKKSLITPIADLERKKRVISRDNILKQSEQVSQLF